MKYGPKNMGPPFHTRRTWRNHAGNQACTPLRVYEPAGIEELVGVLSEAKRHGVTVRVAGAGHSWSDVCLTDGFLLRLGKFDRIGHYEGALRKAGHKRRALFEVGAGVSINSLNTFLWSEGYALPNMGGYDGQSFVGAISTSTHGSGIGYRALEETVRSIEVVAADGQRYRVELPEGPTDPDAFRVRCPEVKLVQDAEWFWSLVVSVGCAGVIIGVLIEPVDRFFLNEVRARTTWEQERDRLRRDGVPVEPSHYELLVNPFEVDGRRTCIVTGRDPVDSIDGLPKDRLRRRLIPELLASIPHVDRALSLVLSDRPSIAPRVIEMTLRAMQDVGYAGKSFKVFNIGVANNIGAYSCEIGFPIEGGAYIDAVDALFERIAANAAVGNVYHSAPVALRFVRACEAYLSPQHGQDTCMVELIMVKGTKGAFEMFRSYERESRRLGGRMHWGQYNGVDAEEAAACYPRKPTWDAVRKTLDPGGLFVNAFSARAGLNL